MGGRDLPNSVRILSFGAAEVTELENAIVKQTKPRTFFTQLNMANATSLILY